MRIDYGGAVIPWYEAPLAGGVNYTWQEKPVAPPVEEIKQYIANEQYQQEKMRESSGGFNDFMGKVDPIKMALIAAATISGNPELIPLIVGADTAAKGGSAEDILKSAGISYVTQGVGSEIGSALGSGTDVLTADDLYTGQAMTNLANSGGEIGSGIGNAAVSTAIPQTSINQYELSPKFDVSPNVTTEFVSPELDPNAYQTNYGELAKTELPTQGTYQMGQGTSLSADASTNPLNPFYNTANPEVSANFNTVSNLVGGGAESNLAALDTLASNPLIPLGGGGIGGAELGSVGSILGTGQGLGQQTLAQVLAPTGLSGVSVQDLASDKPVYSSNLNTTDALRAANTLRKLLTTQKTQLTQQAQKTALQNAQNTQQQSNMANILRGTQMPQTMIPSIYKQQNPFNFGQQNQPVQDTNALAKLLRTA